MCIVQYKNYQNNTLDCVKGYSKYSGTEEVCYIYNQKQTTI